LASRCTRRRSGSCRLHTERDSWSCADPCPALGWGERQRNQSRGESIHETTHPSHPPPRVRRVTPARPASRGRRIPAMGGPGTHERPGSHHGCRIRHRRENGDASRGQAGPRSVRPGRQRTESMRTRPPCLTPRSPLRPRRRTPFVAMRRSLPPDSPCDPGMPSGDAPPSVGAGATSRRKTHADDSPNGCSERPSRAGHVLFMGNNVGVIREP
jgi:hypothetical protein